MPLRSIPLRNTSHPGRNSHEKHTNLEPVAPLLTLAAPVAAIAESSFQTGAGPLTATGRVDFQITIPKILFLQVGTGALYPNNATVNLIDFTVPAASVGNATPIAATAASGDLGNGAVTGIVRGNNGTVTLNATATGTLGNGAGDTINYSEIVTTPTTSPPRQSSPLLRWRLA